jgi:uncharacterized membrane protein
MPLHYALRIRIVALLLAMMGQMVGSHGILAAEFSGIGFLNSNDNVSYVSAISTDGSVVGGVSYREYTLECPEHGAEFHRTYGRAYVWSASQGMRALEPNAEDRPGTDVIHDVSHNGEAVFGASGGWIDYFCETPIGSYDDPGHFIWTSSNGIVNGEGGIMPRSFGRDEGVYIGTQSVTSYWGATQAFRHTCAGGTERLGWLAWGNAGIDDFHGPSSAATGVSSDGDVVVGNSTSAASYSANAYDHVATFTPIPNPPSDAPDLLAGVYNTEAFRWTGDSGMVGLGDLEGGDFGSVATGISGDGNIVIGSSAVEGGGAGFRWSEETGMVQIGGLLPGRSSQLNAVSYDGSRIVGTSIASVEFLPDPSYFGGGRFEGVRAAIIWDEDHGIRNLKDVLQQEYGLDLTGWQLHSADDISADGLTIVGNGINPLGQVEGWVVQLAPIPEPTSIALVGIAVCGLATCIRKRSSRPH